MQGSRLILTLVCIFIFSKSVVSYQSLSLAKDRLTKTQPSIITASSDYNQHYSLHRDKRAADAATTKKSSKKSPRIDKFPLNDAHQQVMVDWAGEGSDVVICVTKDSVQNEHSTSNIYISYDYGTKFKNKTSDFKLEDGRIAVISKFFKNEKFTSYFVFADTLHNYLFLTTDYGKSLTRQKLDFVPNVVAVHPTDPLTMLVFDSSNKTLWITTDFGETWNILQKNVKSYFWSESCSPPCAYVLRENPVGNTLFSYSSFEKGSSTFKPQDVKSNIHELQEEDDFIFFVQKKKASFLQRLLGEKEHDDGLELYITYKGGPALPAEFPNNLSHYNYYVADVSYGQIMLCVFHGTNSNLYVSSYPRSQEHSIRFSLSLERIFYFRPHTNWNGTWLNEVAEDDFADLHHVKGLSGIFIASQYQTLNKKDQVGPEDLISLITFDKGAEWSRLQPPTLDIDGNSTNCTLDNKCSLHICQELSRLYPASQSRPILTSKSAPGIILATGTLGSSQKGHLGVYLSSDAGASWHHVLRGHHVYTLGDHGGIMIAVQFYHYTGETDTILYSLNEGLSWESFKFYDEKLRVYGLMTEPGENTTIFSLYGSKHDKHHWIIVKIDMSPLFERDCNKNDYKPWTPADSLSTTPCLLGRKELFERRIPVSICFNGRDYDRPISIENCPCAREDYECDFGFILNSTSSKCIKDPQDIINPFSSLGTCDIGPFYNKTKGYRKIPGDSCIGGKDFDFEPELIPCSVKEENEFLLVSSRQNILRYDLLNPNKGLEPLPMKGVDSVIALDFDMAANCLYWSNVNTKEILRQCFDGQHDFEVILSKELNSVEGMALDWVSKNLYFVDSGRKVIEVLKLDPSHSKRFRRVILDNSTLDLPRGIALHPAMGVMFFTDWSDTNPMVAKANLDGTNNKILFDKETVSWPNGITVDFHSDRIFWADAKQDYIASAELDGSHFRKIISDNKYVMQPFAVGVYKSLLFWDDWNMFQVLQADKEHGWGVTPLSQENIVGLVDLKIFGHWTQMPVNSACSSNSTNTCQFMCISAPGNAFTCLCPPWLTTSGDNHHRKCLCPNGKEPNEYYQCHENANTCAQNFFKCDNGVCIPESMKCDRENDCGDYSDERGCSMSDCDPPSWQCDNGHCISPKWKCDGDNDCGDNSDEKECAEIKCEKEQFLCANGKCINKEWKCDMQDDCDDNSDEKDCVYPSHNPDTCRSSEFTCVDRLIGSRCIPISWQCDKEEDCKDGSDEKNCTDHQCGAWQFHCPQGKCIFRTWLCDGDQDCSDGADEANCTDSTSHIFPDFPFPQPYTPKPPIRWDSSNNSCPPTYSACDNGLCVPFWWRCDGADDCGDYSDERDCDFDGHGKGTTSSPVPTQRTSRTCHENQMECADGSCIWESSVCDGYEDCPGADDEKNCSSKSSCSLEEFKCVHSKGCIPIEFLCNNHPDCADKSDEVGCGNMTHNHSISCTPGFFACDGGLCLKSFKRCDGNHDCFDHTDEMNCTEDAKFFQVVNIIPSLITNTTLSIHWEVKVFINPHTSPSNLDFEYKAAFVEKAAFGNKHAWKNGTWTTDSSWTFKTLTPYTTYNIHVYVRDRSTKREFSPIEMVEMTTDVGVPSPPMKVKVAQVGDRLQITWEPPRYPNGPLEAYNVYISRSESFQHFKIKNEDPHALRLPIQFKDDLSIWMTVSNSEFSSNTTKSIQFKPMSIDNPVSALNVFNFNSSYAHIKWNPISGVEGYRVRYAYPENKYLVRYFERNVTKPNIELKNLAPGISYTVKVQPYNGTILGQIASLQLTTTGSKLPPVEGLHVKVSQYLGTQVEVHWTKPNYADEVHPAWQYQILWGKSIQEVQSRINNMTTTNTSATIKHLDACESYIVNVMISGPIGIGPVNDPVNFMTREDPLAPPKRLKLSVKEKIMTIMWEHSCPQSKDENLSYLLNITELTHGRSSLIDVPANSSSIKQMWDVSVHYGGHYQVILKTGLGKARPSKPMLAFGPELPAPYELTYSPRGDSFFWRVKRNIPKEILGKYTFVLYLTASEKTNGSSPDMEIDVKEPPYIATEMSPGKIYYASVALKDEDGYLSPKSTTILVERSIGDSLVITKGNAVGVAVAVIIVIALLVGLVAMLVSRHKKLANSFRAFAHTHYDRSQGTTLITSDHNLDEDDDSPIIRGFSDDEPLVIA